MRPFRENRAIIRHLSTTVKCVHAGTLTVGSDGSGTDVTFYSTTSSVYMLWDASAAALLLGQDDYGVDLKCFGDTASQYMLWDASANALLFSGAAARAQIGAFANTAGSGYSMANGTTALRVYADDGGSSSVTSASRAIWARLLLTVNAGDTTYDGVLGQVKLLTSADASADFTAGVRGYLELNGTHTVNTGGANANIGAGAFGVRSNISVADNTTIATGHYLAGYHAGLSVAAGKSITQTGVLCGYGVFADDGAGGATPTDLWGYGFYVSGGTTDTGIGIAATTTGISFLGDMTTGIDMTSSLSATDAILIAGANADAIHISGSNTVTALHISGDQAIGILYDVDAAATDGLKIAVDDGITLTTGINLCRSGTTGVATTGISIDTDGTTALSVGTGFSGVDMIVLAGSASAYGIEITGTCTTAGIFLDGTNSLMFDDSAMYIRASADGHLEIVSDDTITLSSPGHGGIVFGGETDWGTGATGHLIDGTGYDWVTQTVGRVNADISGTSVAASYNALSVTITQTNSTSVFGTWTELYFGASVDFSAADNCAAVWGQIETGASFSAPATAGDFMAAVYANIISGATFTTGADSAVNGVRVQSEISTTTISHAGRMAAVEILTKSGSQLWDYGLYITGADCTVAIQAGADASDGGDVRFYGAATGEAFLWDSSAATLDITSTTTAADDMVSIYQTNNSTASSGYHRTLYVLTDHDADMTGTASMETLGVDFVIQDNVGAGAHNISCWTGFYSSCTFDEWSAIYAHADALQTCSANVSMCNLEMVTSTRTSSACMAFIQTYSHTGASGMKQVIWLEGTNAIADYFVEMNQTVRAPFEATAAGGATRSHRVAWRINGTTYYMSLYTD